MVNRCLQIGSHKIGEEHMPFVIAEMSGNHNQSLDKALALLEVAAKSGAHAVKLQTYTADTLTIPSDRPEFKICGGLWDGYTLYDLYQKAYTPWKWHEAIFSKGHDLGITVFSSPFDFTAVDFLEELDAPAYKIASPELVDIPLIEYVAQTGKPMIISTGMGSLEEIRDAVSAARRGGCTQLAILHCVSAYPAQLKDANLGNITDLQDQFDAVIGLSDHTLGTAAAVAAVALGASIIEKHFTISRSEGGVDSAFSLEPDELARLVNEVCDVRVSIRHMQYGVKPSEQGSLIFRRSLYVVSEMKKGDVFTCDNVRSIRPSLGLPPKLLKNILGKEAARDIQCGEPLKENMIEGLE